MNRPGFLCFEATMGFSYLLPPFYFYIFHLLFFRCSEWKDKKRFTLMLFCFSLSMSLAV